MKDRGNRSKSKRASRHNPIERIFFRMFRQIKKQDKQRLRGLTKCEIWVDHV